MKKMWAIAVVGMREVLADPMYLVFSLAVPVMMTWAMSFLPKVDGIYEMASLGVLVMFVAMNLITSAGAILEDRQMGTWQRLLASPISYLQIMGGYFVKLFLLAWIQVLALLLSGKYLFGAPWNEGYGSMVVVLTIYIFAMTGLGLFLAGLLRTQKQVQAVAMAVVMVGTMLGGIFFPIEDPNIFLKAIATVSPQSWAANALNDIFTSGVPVTQLGTPLLWMGGIGLALLLAGVLRLRFEA